MKDGWGDYVNIFSHTHKDLRTDKKKKKPLSPFHLWEMKYWRKIFKKNKSAEKVKRKFKQKKKEEDRGGHVHECLRK